MNEARRLLKNTGIIAIGGMATKLVQFLLLPLYTTALSTTEYGTIDYLNILAVFCVPVVSLLMDEAIFRFLIDCETPEEKIRVVTSACFSVVFGSLIFSVGCFIYWLVAHPKNLAWIVLLVFTGAALQMVSATLRGFGDTVAYATLNFAASASTIALNIIFISVFNWGVAGMLSATVLAQGLSSLLYIVRKRIWKYINLKSLDYSYCIEMIRYSIPLIPNKVSWTIMNMSSRVVIMNVLGAGSAGLFAVAYKFPNVMDQIYGFFYQSWKESSARALSSDGNEVEFYNSIYFTLRRAMMSIVFLMSALMPLAFKLLINPSYFESLVYVPVLLLATFYSNISGFYGGIFTAHKDTKIMGTTTVCSAVISLVLNVVLIPMLGLKGAAVSALVSMVVVNEYRRKKVAKYAMLTESRVEAGSTLICGLIIFGSFYMYMTFNSHIYLCISILIASIYTLVANRVLISKIIRLA